MDRAALEQAIIDVEVAQTRATQAYTATNLTLETAREVAHLSQEALAASSEMLVITRQLLPPEPG